MVESSPGVYQGDVRIVTSVTDFAIAERAQGAAAAFAVVEDERGNPAARDVPGARRFGDQSELTHYSQFTLDQGEPYKELNLTFRVGDLIADVSVVDYTGAEPDVAITETLAEALLAKIERVRAGKVREPGLSWRLLRLAPDVERIYRGAGYDGYVRLDWQMLPEFYDLAEALQAAGAAAPSPGTTPQASSATAIDPATQPIDTYHYWTPIGEGDMADPPYYRVQLRRYSTAEGPAGRLAGLRETLRQPLDPGGPIIERTVDDDAVFGDEGFAVWYGYGEDGVVATRRYIIYARVGAQFASVEVVDLPAGAKAPAAAMAALMAAQVACLQAVRWCGQAPVPAAVQSAASGRLSKTLPRLP